MKNAAMMLGTISCCALSACSPSEAERVDPNLKCAALISAANLLVSSGKAENDAAFAKRALVSSMTYLNAYAIPKGLKQAEAFDAVKSLRASLIAELQPVEIMSSAKRCAESSPR